MNKNLQMRLKRKFTRKEKCCGLQSPEKFNIFEENTLKVGIDRDIKGIIVWKE